MVYFQNIEGSPQNSVISQIIVPSFTFTADCPATYMLFLTQVIGNDSGADEQQTQPVLCHKDGCGHNSELC